jgi:biotin carboxyl carrier protein
MNKTTEMKRGKSLCYILCVIFFALFGCSRNTGKEEKQVSPKVPVEVVQARTGLMTDYAELMATSTFFDKAVVKAPAGGFVENSSVNPGDFVKKGQQIMTLRTKESAALESDSTNPLGFSGLIKVKSGIDGVVTSMDHPVGDYVQEGDQLGMISVPGSLVFILEAPFSINAYIRIGKNCEVLLPDGKKTEARIQSQLPAMSGSSQTQRYVVKPQDGSNLPENLVARIRIPKTIILQAVILPKTCILSDELMHSFWVMKLINDSMAVKIAVTPGLSSGDSVQILEPHFTEKDLILSSGNYGVGDTLLVSIIKKTN